MSGGIGLGINGFGVSHDTESSTLRGRIERPRTCANRPGSGRLTDEREST